MVLKCLPIPVRPARTRPARTRWLALLALVLLVSPPSPVAAIEVGEAAPEFRAKALSGPKPLSLRDYRG